MTDAELVGAVEPLLLGGSGQIVTTMLLALALGVVVALVYRLSVPGRVLSPTMQSSLVLLAMVSAMVMMVIGSSIARAFALVGALAIVRFRTRLRSAWDISFVFFALAAGIGCGVLAYRVAVLGTGLVSLAVLGLQVLPLAGVRPDRLRMLRCDVAAFEGVEAAMNAVLDRHLLRHWLVEARSQRFGESLSLRYRTVMRDPAQVVVLLRELSAVEGIERVIVGLGEEADEGEE